jgi:hypothetical protein
MRRRISVVMVAFLAVSASASLTGCGAGTPTDGPPLVNGYYVAAGDRCGESCPTFGKWRATAAAEVYAEALDKAEVIAHIATGDTVTTAPGQTLVRPLRGTVQAPGGGLKAGDIVYRLLGDGEGFSYDVWRKGEVLNVDAEGARAPTIQWDQAPANLPSSVWWVRVELQDGKKGWLRNPSSFDGMGPLS